MADYVIGLRITGDGRLALQTFNEVQAAARGLATALGNAGSQGVQGMQQVEQALDDTKQAAAGAADAVTKVGASAEAGANKATRAITATEQATQQLDQALTSTGQSVNTVSTATTKLGTTVTAGAGQASRALNTTAQAAEQLDAALGRSSGQAVSNLGNTARAAGDLDASLGRASASTQRFGVASREMGSAVASSQAQAASAVSSTQRAVDAFDQSVEHGIGTVGRWAAALVGLHAIKEFADGVVEDTNKLIGWEFGLQAATGSSQKAGQALDFVRGESDRLGISLEESASVFIRLAAASKGTAVEGAKAQAVFTSISEAARALHLSSTETGQALLALDQMMSKGTVQAQELKLQLGNVLPGATHVLADALGVTTAQLEKMMDAGQVLAADALPKLATQLHAIYGTAAAEAADAPAAQIQRLKNAVFDLKTAIGNAGFMDLVGNGAKLAADGVKLLGDNVQAAATLLTAFGAARATAWAADLVASRSAQAQTVALAATELEEARAAEAEAAAHLAKARAFVGSSGGAAAAARVEAVLAAAQLRTAEATAAATAAGAARVGVLARLGTGLLSLAGGPIGVAVIAVGALAAGWVALQDAEERRRAAFEKTLGQMDAATTQAQALHTQLTALSTVQAPPLADSMQQLASALDAVAKAQDAVNQKQAEIAGIQARIDAAQRDTKGDGIGLLAIVPRLQEARNELTQLEDKLHSLQGASNEVSDDIQGRFAPAIEVAAASLKKLATAGSLTEMWADLKAGVSGFVAAANGIQQADVQAQNLSQQVTKAQADATEKLKTAGKTQVEIAKDLIKQQHDAAVAANWTPEAIKNQDALNASMLKTVTQLQAQTTAHKDAAKAAREQAAAQKAAEDDLAKFADLNDRLAGNNAGPIAKAMSDSVARIRDIAQLGGKYYEDLKNAGVDSATAEARARDQVAQSLELERGERERALDAARKQQDVAGDMIKQMQEESRVAGLSQRDQAIARAGMQAETKLRQGNLGLTEDQIAAQKAQVEAAAAGLYDVQKAMEQQQAYAQEFAGYWNNGVSSVSRAFGDLFTGQIDSARDFGRNLVDIAKQTVSDMIAQYLRLQVIGPILNGALGGLGGGSSGLLAYAANYYGSGGTLGPAPGGDSAGTGGAGGASAATSYASYLQQGLSNYRTYNTLKGWLTGGTGYATYGNTALNGSLATGYGNSVTAAQGYLGQYGATPTVYSGIGVSSTPTAVPWGGTYSIGGYTAPVASYAGGIAGALYGTQQGSGGLSTVGSTLSYGALGAGLAGTAAGVAGGASLGAAAGGAFGSIAAGTSWIPVVGWVLAAIAAVDAISGGKFFGTSYSPTESDSYLNLGPDGGSAQAFVTEKRQGALFSGAKYRTKEVAASAELQKAADQLYSAVSKSMVQGAQQLGVDVPAMINASLQTKVDINSKTGKVKSTEYLVNYLGETWKEATADAAAKRLGAEAIIATVQASAGDAVQGIANQFRDSADTLADAAQAMLAAQTDITKGNSLLALGSSATLAQVIEFVSELQQSGESLADAYQRVAQAGASYLQFVNQFKPTASTLGGSLQAIAQQMQANIDQANALAQAAGLQGAREQDLANIHQAAAQQAADALAQLSTAAQDLATKLYGATGTTLAAVQAQIDQVQAKLQSATQTAIGDLSPLSAKEKLDVALKGLRSGVTSASDVLQLGRQLYASGSDYNALYAKVMAITGQPATAAALGTQLDSYNGLVSQRDQLQAQADSLARFNDAKTLAQYVADISSAHGVSYGEAAQGLGFSLSDLAKDLGVTNLTGYLDTLQQQDLPGTVMTASSSIVDAIRDLGRDLLSTLTGAPLADPGPAAPVSVGTSTPEQLALLQQINDKLAQLNATTFKVATSTGKTASNTSSSALRTVASSTR